MFWSSDKEAKNDLQKMDRQCWKARSEQRQQHHHHHHHHHHHGPTPPTMTKHWERKHCHSKEKVPVPPIQHGCGHHGRHGHHGHHGHHGPSPMMAKYLERKHCHSQEKTGEYRRHCFFQQSGCKPTPIDDERNGWFWG